MVEAIDRAREDRDTLGGMLEVRVFGAPPVFLQQVEHEVASTMAQLRAVSVASGRQK